MPLIGWIGYYNSWRSYAFSNSFARPRPPRPPRPPLLLLLFLFIFPRPGGPQSCNLCGLTPPCPHDPSKIHIFKVIERNKCHSSLLESKHYLFYSSQFSSISSTCTSSYYSSSSTSPFLTSITVPIPAYCEFLLNLFIARLHATSRFLVHCCFSNHNRPICIFTSRISQYTI